MSSSREREILERQRRLAASLPSKPAATETAVTSTQQPGPTSASATSLRRPSSKKPSSSLAILAAARASAQQSTKPSTKVFNVNTADGKTKPSPRFSRKEQLYDSEAATLESTIKTPKLLSQLVQNAAATSSASIDSEGQSFGSIHPEDFWKSLREWDVLTQYYKVQHSIPLDANLNRKTLPDTFINARHYMAAWAPLCLAECKAQLLQDFPATTLPISIQCNIASAGGIPLHRRSQAYYDAIAAVDQYEDAATYIQLAAPTNATYAQMQSVRNTGAFTNNDLVLLLAEAHKDLPRDLCSKRKPAGDGKVNGGGDGGIVDYSRAGLVGHVEQGRASMDGLLIKVSKRKWAQIGQKNMFVIPWKGGNVTALREFTALCRMETLPLKRYLLGQHLVNGKTEHKKVLHRLNSQQLLNEMGGREALGKGFVEYATKKFNNSQLTAIAASANQYGDGGFTLIKGPPGTGKTTTLVACLNSLHIRQYNKYYEEVRRIAALPTGTRSAALEIARKAKPRLLCCAPSNTAVDNIILKIMEDGFVDGQGRRYNPSIIRVGVGQSPHVRAVALETKVDSILSEHMDAGKLDTSIFGYKSELSRITSDIAKLRRRCQAMTSACPWPLSRDWEIRINEETFDEVGGVFFVNHREQSTTFEVPPPPEPGETQFLATSMPEYRAFMARIVKLVENYFTIKTYLERCTIIKGATDNRSKQFEIQQNLESHVLNSVHIVMTTLGSAGGRALEGIDKFEVVVIDEAAQSVEPQSLSALQLGNRHAVLVGDPQQLPATIFNVSGKTTKYDRSLFQRLEEAGEPVYMLNEQYRMHPKISHFPRHIFYEGTLLDGPNVKMADYGNPLIKIVGRALPTFQPFTVLDLDSSEERGGPSLANPDEAELAVFLYLQLKEASHGLTVASRVAVITPYAQQSKLLQRYFERTLGPKYADFVEVNTVDAFQGREANIVIFSAVRASGSRGIGFLADVRRMNVALTRAKYMLFVIARCESIAVNPYWRDLVEHAKETNAVVRVPTFGSGASISFGKASDWVHEVASSALTVSSANIPEVHDDEKPTAALRPYDPRKKAASRKDSKAFHSTSRLKASAKPGDTRKPKYQTVKNAIPTETWKADNANVLTQSLKSDKPKPPAYQRNGNSSKPSDPRQRPAAKRKHDDNPAAGATLQPSDPRKRGRGYHLT